MREGAGLLSGDSAIIEPQSTRLFPKHHGASGYRLSGIAARCDWVVLSDLREGEPDVALVKIQARPPRVIFLSLRAPVAAFEFFFDRLLPTLDRPFVLVSGSEDVTVPNQRDLRWPEFDQHLQRRIGELRADPRLVHWFIENRDEALPGTSSLPVGYVFEGDEHNRVRVPGLSEPMASRPLRALCAHRIRVGPQWMVRKRVTDLCSGPWSAFVDVQEEELSLSAYIGKLRRYPFLLCAEGGGIDPSPKAWLALVQGTIPIVRRSALEDAYGELPVAWVDDWSPGALTGRQLEMWLQELAPWFEQPERRRLVVERLCLDYWWNKIESRAPAHD